MDSPAINLVSICSGIGGLDLGVGNALRSLGYAPRTICYVEREAFACAVLASRMETGDLDSALIWTDVKTLQLCASAANDVGVDMVIGGIPCQDFSIAGKRSGTDGERWLWPDFWRIVRETNAKILFLENVPGFISVGGLAAVLSDLAACGWYAEWDCFSASEIGATHRRERFFMLAYRDGAELHGRIRHGNATRRSGFTNESSKVAHPDGERRGGEGGIMEMRPRSNGKYRLRDHAAHWATPMARDWKGTNSETHVTGTGRNHMDQLANQAKYLFGRPAPKIETHGSMS